jgi:hypothetical protein
MNEILLFSAVVVIIIVASYLTNKINKPAVFYVRIIAAITLVLFIWLTSENSAKYIKIVITVIALSSIVKEFSVLKNFKKMAEKDEEL